MADAASGQEAPNRLGLADSVIQSWGRFKGYMFLSFHFSLAHREAMCTIASYSLTKKTHGLRQHLLTWVVEQHI